MSIDWSNYQGNSYVTGPRDQGGSNFCWGFANTGLVESMVRIEHGVWCERSEGDVFTGLNYYSFLGGEPKTSGDFIASNGIADAGCLPWSGRELNYTYPATASADRSGRVVHTPALTSIVGLQAQQTWLDSVGPLIGTFDVYADFDVFWYGGTGVYHNTAPAGLRGQHVVLLIGYDNATACWIAKNSWGTSVAHPDGIFRIGFGEVRIDAFEKYGLQGTNPDPSTKRRHHAGGLVVSGNGGRHANLEFTAAGPKGAVRWWYKDSGAITWNHIGDFGLGHPFVTGSVASPVGLTQTTFNRNFDAVWLTDPSGPSGPLQHWVFKQDVKQWHPDVPTGFGPADAVGAPVLIQSNFGEPGSLELLVATGAGQISHWTRRNARPWLGVPPGTWQERARFGTGVRRCGQAFVQLRAGAWPWGEQGAGDLVTVLVADSGRLQHWQRQSGVWSLVDEFAGGVDGAPCLIEALDSSSEWAAGSLVLFVAVDGAIEHWVRPPGPGTPWQRLARFGGGIADVRGVAQGHAGIAAVEVIAETTTHVFQHWRVAPTPGGWTQTYLVDLP
ncbi:C1 family peptidase [Dactylosporangium sp. NPDC051541]|uniref:C1 family peptidase n=1 Tax=Dactylosporangium sp. NPDC051541 TaxID=3363977 RepID=UPI0037B8EBBD